MPDFFLITFCNVQLFQSDHRNFDHPKMPRISSKESLLNEYKAVAPCEKAYIRFCLDEEVSFEDEIDDCLAAVLEILLAEALGDMFWCLKQCFTQNNGPSHSSFQTLSLVYSSSLDEIDSKIPQLHIFLSFHLHLDISSAFYI